ncbi:MAG TPA: putative glycolipid-binding domain-containing protein [Gemmatimonadales bacterium]|nr:putative glycolipid-binding domain-containing protein [Gemmatimonadales bacterium]
MMRWRRLDLPGHDQARLRSEPGSRRLEGHAEFSDGTNRWDLRYSVSCTLDWTTTRAIVRGHSDRGAIEATVVRSAGGGWTLNGAPVPAVAGCIDVDLAFTPATNLLSLRRLDLAVGQKAEVVAAWLTFPEFALTPLRQRYHRTSQASYDYSAPDLPFAGILTVNPDGFVIDYAGLWRGDPQATE